MNSIRSGNTIRSIDRSLNPVPNIEKSPGAGGSSFHIAKSIDPMKRGPHVYPAVRQKPMAAVVHIAMPKMQGGGSVDQAMPDPEDLREPDENLSPRDQKMKEIVVEAMAALRGQHPDPQKAIQRFIDAFGVDELRELKQMMSQEPEPDEDDAGGPPDNDEDDMGGPPPPQAPPSQGVPAGMQVGGLLHGPGSGQDDQIEAQTPAGRRVLLSDGEYVIDAPTVAALGDGSTDAGARRLDQFRKAVRQQSYGHDQQAKPLSRGGRMALLEALNE